MRSRKHWKLVIDDRVAVLYLDSAPKQNVLHGAALEELDDITRELRALHSTGDVVAAVIASAKETSFCAGADVNEIWALRDAADDEVSAVLELAQETFQRILRAPFPTVAAVSGECLGGGLELTLFCDMRIASSQPKTRFEAPETKLGVIPGFGGTQLLPRIVGFRTALEMVVGGKALDAQAALRAGLVDRVVTQDDLLAEAKKAALEIASGQLRPKHSLPRAERIPMIRALLRRYMLHATRKMTLAKTKGNYPAFLFACDAVWASTRDLAKGWAKEHALFVQSLKTPAAKSCMSIFLTQQEARSRQWVSEIAEPPKKVGIVGAGPMGRGIAYVLASRGIPVIIEDLSAKAIHDSIVLFESLFKKEMRRGKITKDDAARTMNLITYKVSGDYRMLRDCDLVVEAVIERVDIKRQVLKQLEDVLAPDAVIATNTSSIPLEELAPALRDPSRFLAMHFFNPVFQMDLVEIAGHAGTAPSAFAKALATARAMRKTPVVLDKACPGFVVNRVLFPYLALSLQAILEGRVAPDELDAAFKRMGMVMGPIETLDLVGFDVGAKVLETLGGFYGEPYDYSRFTRVVAEKKILGQKTGSGFYTYDKKGKRGKVNDAFLAQMRSNSSDPHGNTSALMTAGAIYESMCAVGRELVVEGICKDPKFVDLACVLGAGITPNRRGLFGAE
jgi:3-hydroxyacyl-CoA dehydrogenase/enoyl-CoA hydratase/carnithine racemase